MDEGDMEAAAQEAGASDSCGAGVAAVQTKQDTYSDLRIKNISVSPVEVAGRFIDIRFVRISAPRQEHIRLPGRNRRPLRRHRFVRISAFQNLAGGDTFSGCWATAGVVLDKGTTRVSTQGTVYSILKMGTLDDSEVSVFLFGDAHTHYSGGAVGDVFTLFNGNVRVDKGGKGSR